MKESRSPDAHRREAEGIQLKPDLEAASSLLK